MRRYSACARYNDRIIRIAPDRWEGYIDRGRIEVLGRGNVSAGQRLLHEGLEHGDGQRLLALMWLFVVRFGAPEDRDAMLLLPVEAFGSDTMGYYASKGQVWRLRGDSARTRAYYDSLRAYTTERIRRRPQDDAAHTALGYAYARLGRAADAVREGRRGVELLPVSRDAYEGSERLLDLAKIYAVVGDADAAVDQLSALLEIPSWVSPAWLRVSWDWDEIRDNSRFQQLTHRPLPAETQ
ncbi:MAG TPA: hypothetical protein VFB89_10810 [Gemmatimonadales bacterium]|nr:hypothetical protein [Gemmatimonadales bacterium]